jgi:UDP-N-acetyl-D-mannosaminuronic acid dehydrogenase
MTSSSLQGVASKRVCIIGLGYIGLPTAAIIAAANHEVLGIDKKADVVELINQGSVHINEPQLDELVKTVVKSGNLRASTEYEACDIYIICVPTPFLDVEGSDVPQPDLAYVLSATRSICPFLKQGDLIILESTSPVGTVDQIISTIQQERGSVEGLHFAYCPERVLPGNIVVELRENDRIIGGSTDEATKLVAEFYRTFVKGNVLSTTARTAEMAKLVENSYRDVNIAFANEVSMLAEEFGVNVWELRELVNRHPRVKMLMPGSGVGGHCIAVDPWFLVAKAPSITNIIKTARKVNLAKTEWVIERITTKAAALREKLQREPVVACFGVTFKPNVEDMRESPALEIVEHLIHSGLTVKVVDPHVKEETTLDLVPMKDALANADFGCILVGHDEFTSLYSADLQLLDFVGMLFKTGVTK